jgi:hydrogenase maturation protease
MASIQRSTNVLIACVGNIFLGDDGFGVEVARRLAMRPLPKGVEVVDFGIRGFDLAFALLDERAYTILVDALPRGGEPGTLYVLDPDLDNLGQSANIAGHGMDPLQVLQLVRTMGGEPRNILVLGCEPLSLGDGNEADVGLSPVVEASVPEAIDLIESLLVGHVAMEPGQPGCTA